jgi:GNAT superfamily N-acetyltransferase
MTTIRIASVDASQDATAALLNYLQLAILPSDTPHELEGYWWIAYDGELPIGFAGVTQSKRWGDTGYLCRAGVIRSHRGQGVQTRLIRVRERKARDIGWNWLITDTYKNPASANSLIRCGYRTFLPANPWSFDGAIYWRKRLA